MASTLLYGPRHKLPLSRVAMHAADINISRIIEAAFYLIVEMAVVSSASRREDALRVLTVMSFHALHFRHFAASHALYWLIIFDGRLSEMTMRAAPPSMLARAAASR